MTDWGRDSYEVLNTIEVLKANELNKKTLVILSGGMDSATCLYIAKVLGSDVSAISFSYGQKHYIEVNFAKILTSNLRINHEVVKIDIASHFKTALGKDSHEIIPSTPTEGQVPATYVPFRNTIMLSIAAGYAESWGFDRIFYGANIIDYSGYPDCRPEYIKDLNTLIKTASPNKTITIEAPILYLTKADVVKLGSVLGVPWEYTWSCYRGSTTGVPCKACPSCFYRAKGFEEAQIKDPLLKYE